MLEAFGIRFDFGPFSYVIFAFGLVWAINLFNFMDGIDGIAGVEALTMLGSAALILFISGHDDWLVPVGFLISCTAGFLVWNWPPAKVFMGDSCSAFLGFVIGLLALSTSASGLLNVWVWLILGSIFIVDATTTLITRVLHRAAWYQRHRSHAYQILARHFGNHQSVTIRVLAINLLWLFPLAFAAKIYPKMGLLICLIAWLPILGIVIWVGAGREESGSMNH